MTENEAIEILEERYLTMSMCGDIEQCKRNNQAISSAVTALTEIQQYRVIGTVKEFKNYIDILNKTDADELAKIIDEWLLYQKIGTVAECREARERQRGKKPIRIAPCKSVNYFKCSSCGNFLSIDKPFCEECGNAVDWYE